MSPKRMGDHKPKKLTTLLFPPEEQVSYIQDDGGGLAAPQEAYTDLPDEHQGEINNGETPRSPTLDPGADPILNSPAKARMWIDAPPQRPPQSLLEAQAFNPLQSNQALHTSMASYPTSGQPVMDTTLKDMLMSLQTSLMTDLSTLFNKLNYVSSLENRVSTIERGMSDCSSTVNNLIDSYDEVKD